MWATRLLLIVVLIWFYFAIVASFTMPHAENHELEEKLLSRYNNRVRPVKKEKTVTQVMVFLNIAHVEKVDEEEQTALLHGHIWATWIDEYLQWDRKKENNTAKITVMSGRIWQPALSVYNSAKGNAWHIYMGGLPATVYHNGKVWSTGTFSFAVTCQFNFKNWPFDVQKCPIVIADWVYGLAQVNLSDPNIVAEYAKPSIRLSYDPLSENKRNHVGGWTVTDAWKKHCYWGPQGCQSETPKENLDWYWSLLEFGVYLNREMPYVLSSVLMPTLCITLLILLNFWLESFRLCLYMAMCTGVFQTMVGRNLLMKMPPGSGAMPKIMVIYGVNMMITMLQASLSMIFKGLTERFSDDFHFDFEFDILELPKKLGIDAFFKHKGLTIDPEDLFSDDRVDSLEAVLDRGGDNANTLIGIGNPLNDDTFKNFRGSVTSSSTSDTDLLIDMPTTSEPAPVLKESIETLDETKNTPLKGVESIGPALETKLEQQIHYIKRFLFYFVVFLDFIILLGVLFL